MIWCFTPDAIKPTTVRNIAFSGETLDDISPFLYSEDVVLEARGTLEESFDRLVKRKRGYLGVKACVGVFPVLNFSEDMQSKYIDYEIPFGSDNTEKFCLAAIIVAAVNNLVDAECSRLYKRGEYIDAVVLDAMAFFALDKAIEHIREELLSEIVGMSLGQCFYAGTKQMRLDVMRPIFQLLRPDEKIDVRLTQELIMIPFRSVSVVIPGTHSENSFTWPKKTHYQKKIPPMRL